MDIETLKNDYPLQLGANNPILRTETDTIKRLTDEQQQLADALIPLMHHYNGVGLAAPQVNKKWRMAAVTQWDFSSGEQKLLSEQVIINPELVGKSADKIVETEACLSLPGMEGKVARAKKITVKYMSPKGEEKMMTATGYNARIILHEMDHLDGVLFIDKTT